VNIFTLYNKKCQIVFLKLLSYLMYYDSLVLFKSILQPGATMYG